MNGFELSDKTYLVFGVANKRSVAFFTAKTLINNGANVILSIQNEELKPRVEKLFPDTQIYICNLEKEKILKGCMRTFQKI